MAKIRVSNSNRIVIARRIHVHLLIDISFRFLFSFLIFRHIEVYQKKPRFCVEIFRLRITSLNHVRDSKTLIMVNRKSPIEFLMFCMTLIKLQASPSLLVDCAKGGPARARAFGIVPSEAVPMTEPQ